MSKRLKELPAICDANLLVGLFMGDHEFSAQARAWFNLRHAGEVCVPRSSQLALLRLLSNPTVAGRAVLTPDQAIGAWQLFERDPRVRLIVQEPDGLQTLLFRLARDRKAAKNLWSDLYLAAFAIAGRYSLATFDKGFKWIEELKLEPLLHS